MLNEGSHLQHPDFPIYYKYLAKARVYILILPKSTNVPKSTNGNTSPLVSSYGKFVILKGMAFLTVDVPVVSILASSDAFSSCLTASL